MFKLSELLECIDISKSSYCQHKKQLVLPDNYGDERIQIIKLFKNNKRQYGYRRIQTALNTLSEKTVQRIMREKNLVTRLHSLRFI